MDVKILSVLTTVACCVWLMSCTRELDIHKAGNLVPKTVEDDPSLTSILVNGTVLHAETYGNPVDPMVIFLHGGPGADYQNGLKVKELAENGYYVVFYDQRGTGLSKRHEKESYSIQLYLDDLSSVVQHYRTNSTQKIFLFGHSWGAMLAAAYINSFPDRIDGAIFAEAGGFNKQLLDEYGETSRKINLFEEATNDVLYYDQFLTGREDEHEILDFAQKEAAFFSNAEIIQIDDTGHEMIYFKWNLVYPVVTNYLNSLN